jgi:hypothetical protein
MPYQPDREKAADICYKLLEFSNDLRKEVVASDPEGRTFGLGLTMFYGLFLSAFPDEKDRRMSCDAAMGYALIPERALPNWHPKRFD